MLLAGGSYRAMLASARLSCCCALRSQSTSVRLHRQTDGRQARSIKRIVVHVACRAENTSLKYHDSTFVYTCEFIDKLVDEEWIVVSVIHTAHCSYQLFVDALFQLFSKMRFRRTIFAYFLQLRVFCPYLHTTNIRRSDCKTKNDLIHAFESLTNDFM